MTTITLSFDNGPDPEVTPQVLDTLRRRDIKATFFVLGDKLRDRRAFAERAHAEGHWIGNHTFTHLVPLGLSPEAGMAASEITRTEALLGDLAHERRFFRPFGGGGLLDKRLLNREAFDLLTAQRYTCVLWNAIPQDWSHPEGWVQRALDLCFAQDHTLLVLHDLPTGAMKHLDRFIGLARERGAAFVQDFPADCVPLERGRLTRPIDAYLTEAAA
jgi:peptidoglycan/xylan/chitin deacetylase (PgdA/CDA1 family)